MSHAKQWNGMGSDTTKYLAQGSLNAESHALDAMLKEARRNPTRWSQEDIKAHIDYFFRTVYKNYLAEIGY